MSGAVGIVAEYNPFHKGHLYHIRKSRYRAQNEAIVTVISSNFVQRGEPALLDKEARTRMALSNSADLVLELPVVYSSHNALPFASAAIDILAATGVVDAVSFGMETPDVEVLLRLAEILNREPEAFRHPLMEALDMGFSFVQARGMALDTMMPGALDFLKMPNNNLSLSYVKRILEKGYAMEPFAVKRAGAGYHDKKMSGEAASATAIRTAINEGDLESARSGMPPESASIFEEAFENGHIADSGGRYWRHVKQAIVRSSLEELSKIAEMSEGFHNRMADMAWKCDSLDSFADACTSRRYTKGRVFRYCAHLLIGLRHEENRVFQAKGPAYIRVLGMNERGKELLRKMKESALLPVISRPSAPFSGYAARMMDFEHRAAELWELLTENPRAGRERRYVPAVI